MQSKKPILTNRNILITGGCGFIGSNFLYHIMANAKDCVIVNLDLLTYASNIENLNNLSWGNSFCNSKLQNLDSKKLEITESKKIKFRRHFERSQKSNIESRFYKNTESANLDSKKVIESKTIKNVDCHENSYEFSRNDNSEDSIKNIESKKAKLDSKNKRIKTSSDSLTINGDVRSTNLVSPAQLAVQKSENTSAVVRTSLFCKELDKRGSPPFRKKSGCFFLQRGRGVGDMHFFAQCVNENKENDTQNRNDNKNLDSIESQNNLSKNSNFRKIDSIESKNKDSKKKNIDESLSLNMTNNIESRFYKNTKNTKNTNLDSKKSQEKKYQNQNTKKDSKNFTESKNIKAPLKRKSKKIKNYHFIQGDINDSKLLQKIFETYKIDSVIHFAAESHVDNSINSPDIFIKTNINGTFCLLNAAFNAWFDAPFSPKKGFENALFYHISTDEVFGSLGEKGYFSESSPYQPNSPYSASKASSDMLVRSFAHTYGLNAVISNCSNNYGRFQHDEKLIPTIIRKALSGEKIPIYGDGKNVRDWLYVDDHCDAILQIFSHAIENIGRIPRSLAEGGGSKTQKITPDSQKNTDSIESKNFFDTFCIGGGSEMENLTIANIICEMLDSKLPKEKSYKEQISFVKDRFGHDRRYAIDSSKLRKILGWSPKHTFNQAIEKTLDFYIKKYK